MTAVLTAIMITSLQTILLISLTHYSASQYDTPSLPNKRFFAVWNVPSVACKARWNVSLNLEEHGIVVNDGHQWHGDFMNIFYQNYGLWPLYDFRNGSAVNGGIPQVF